METRVFEADPFSGELQLFHYDEVDDTFTIESIVDVEDVVEENKALYADHDGERYGDMTRVAQIPMSIYWELKEKGILDDEKALRRWLNDRDNLVFRTRPGRI